MKVILQTQKFYTRIDWYAEVLQVDRFDRHRRNTAHACNKSHAQMLRCSDAHMLRSKDTNF